MPKIEDFIEEAEQAHLQRQPVAQRMPEEAMLEAHPVNKRENEDMARLGIVLEDYEVCFKPRYKKLVSGFRMKVNTAYMNMTDGYARKQYIEALGVGRQLDQSMSGNASPGIGGVISNLFKGKDKK